MAFGATDGNVDCPATAAAGENSATGGEATNENAGNGVIGYPSYCTVGVIGAYMVVVVIGTFEGADGSVGVSDGPSSAFG